MTAVVTAGAGFLLAVLWFDLMFDVQVLRGREPTRGAVESVSAYYGRVTTGARPMNRLVAVAMMAMLGGVGVQAGRGDVDGWVGWSSLGLAVAPVLLAALHTFPRAVRLGARVDGHEVQARLAREVGRDHLFCLAAITGLLVLQIGFAR